MARIASFLIASACATAALMSISSQSLAGEVTLCGGAEGGGYDTIMRRIGNELEKRGHKVNIRNLGGSEDILNEINNGSCDYGPAQKDIHFKMKSKMTGTLPVSLLYEEVMLLVCTKNSGYDELSDIKEGDIILTDVIGSGSALTWETMVQIENEVGNKSPWSRARVDNTTPLSSASGKMSLGDVKCAFGVNKLSKDNWAGTLEKQGHVVSWIYDKHLDDLEYNGSPLYNSVRIPRGVYKTKFDTYTVPAVLFQSMKFNDKTISALVERMANSVAAN